MQIVPDAVGQSDGALVFWEDNPEIGVAWPQSAYVFHEVRWGMGSLNQAECLILYLFHGDRVIELYIPEVLPTTPTESLNIWHLLCDWQPELIKVRYGTTPADNSKEVTCLLPAGEDESLIDKLRTFVDAAGGAGATDQASSAADPITPDQASPTDHLVPSAQQPDAAGQPDNVGQPTHAALLARLQAYLEESGENATRSQS